MATSRNTTTEQTLIERLNLGYCNSDPRVDKASWGCRGRDGLRGAYSITQTAPLFLGQKRGQVPALRRVHTTTQVWLYDLTHSVSYKEQHDVVCPYQYRASGQKVKGLVHKCSSQNRLEPYSRKSLYLRKF